MNTRKAAPAGREPTIPTEQEVADVMRGANNGRAHDADDSAGDNSGQEERGNLNDFDQSDFEPEHGTGQHVAEYVPRTKNETLGDRVANQIDTAVAEVLARLNNLRAQIDAVEKNVIREAGAVKSQLSAFISLGDAAARQADIMRVELNDIDADRVAQVRANVNS